jgi:hypothetical protein
MSLIESCWRLRVGADHVEVEVYPRCVDAEQRARSVRELNDLLARFAAQDEAIVQVLLDVYARLMGRPVGPADAGLLTAMRRDLPVAVRDGNLVVRRAGLAAVLDRRRPTDASAVGHASDKCIETPRSKHMKLEFWETPAGRHFFEATLPRLVRQIERVADALEALLAKWASRELGGR